MNQTRHLVHLDTDFGGDPDDACALAMLLGWRGVEICGITTSLDVDGLRAGCVHHVLGLAGRNDIPVAAGADASMTTQLRYLPTIGDSRHWPASVQAIPSPEGAAAKILANSIGKGATVIAIGALTNLALLELDKPGSLAGANVVVMGGWITGDEANYLEWGPDMDFNVQCDTRAAEIVAAAADLTLVTLPVAMKAQLRRAHLERLRATGVIGELLANQSAAHGDDNSFTELAKAHAGLADDLVNFHWDPVCAAVAIGWRGATTREMQLRTRMTNGVLRFEENAEGRRVKVVVDIDAEDFAQTWLSSVEAIRR